MIRFRVGFASASGYPSPLRCPVPTLGHLTHIMKKLWRLDNGNFYHTICRYSNSRDYRYFFRPVGIYTHYGLD